MTKTEPTPFTLKVVAVIQKIPRGKVATYKQVAGLAGKPGASRGVVWILNTCTRKYKLPWQRVINAQGKIAFDPRASNFKLQKRLLQNVGVVFTGGANINLAKYQWRKKPRLKRNQPRMFS